MCIYILLILMLMTMLLIRSPCVVEVFRCIHSSTLFLQHPIGFQLFQSKANLRLAFASTLLMCVFQVCLLSKVIPRYGARFVCCSFVSSNIIFMGFDLVDKVKSVVKYLVLFIFTHQSCVQLDKMLVASWSRILVVCIHCTLHWGWKFIDNVVDEY